MSKEKILEEFDKIFENLELKEIQIIGLITLLNKAIDQTREETIKGILENSIMYLKASNLSSFSDYYVEGYKDAIKDLDRYKIKSLINK